ncbi:TIGR02453 family protein [Algicella marina]|uniref:TIGR02453 family protein n=1 Tax=Algicella marina TaxID=2683284 RepID=UPI00137AF39E|nr:DUF2461 domain-containing protein [Algicella marina]
MTGDAFKGFSPEALEFLQSLHANNTREWFATNRKIYESEIKHPAAAFAATLAEEVENLTGHGHNPKVFRVHRDVRFSTDKTPYNAHVRIALVPQGLGPALPMWFFGLGTAKISLGTGIFTFEKESLEEWRWQVVERGEEIKAMLDAQMESGARIEPPALKRIPRNLPADHPQASLFLHKGLSVWRDYGNPEIATDPGIVEICRRDFARLLPVWQFCRTLKA